ALLLVVLGLGGAFFALYLLYQYRKKQRFEQIVSLPFPDEYDAILTLAPHFGRLVDTDREAIRRSILRFIHTKEFIGIGIDVNDEMKVLIAFYACLLLLRKNAPYPYPDLATILIYPDSVMIKQNRTDGGIVTNEEVAIDGQSANGTVVITWDAARSEALQMGPDNLILHEFAHEMDFMDGEIDGVPPMEDEHYDAWIEVLDREFDTLGTLVRNDAELGKFNLFGPEALLDEAEFFAVATERFFGEGAAFREDFPALYHQFRTFYGIDTAELFT
ncbi:MAG: zinc-dependent peptidase, partial [Campylobacterales bacterium]|nr:zinc-dependent peptidase [Campylobacterales bacterium]